MNKLIPRIEKTFSESDVGVLLENISDNIKLVAEGHLDLDRKIENLGKELGGRIDSLEREMKSNFETVFDYLSAIDIELAEIKAKLENKADKKDLAALEQRVSKLELGLGECKKMIAAAKNS
ncbi:MAG: hypothetical protein WCX69_03885 [Candidatus Paceibacterota bacterium]